MLGDRGYDAEAIRQGLRTRHIVPWLAKRNTEHGSGFGRWRWVVERTFVWLNQFRRLRLRYEKRADIHEAFLSLACALLCWNVFHKHAGNLRGTRLSDSLELSRLNIENKKLWSAPDGCSRIATALFGCHN